MDAVPLFRNAMFMCFIDLLIGTMESQRKISCWRKHGATKKERREHFIWSYTRTHIHIDFRCMMFNFFEIPSMFICFSDLLIGTMESRNKIDCWRKHGATKKEVRENFIWSYTRTQIHFDFRCMISIFEIQCSCVSLIS
jgi:hypothetical protein